MRKFVVAICVTFSTAITHAGTLTTLAAFDYQNGAYSRARLTVDSVGDLYGTTSIGGARGGGTVFRIGVAGALTTLGNFGQLSGGWNPNSGLIEDAGGNLYGTTTGGGSNGAGTVFKLSATGSLTTLANFDGTNGANPYAGLILDKSGNLYGTTLTGGASNEGTVFQVGASGKLSTLVSFDGANGAKPYSGLIADAAGNLYGTTNNGGPSGFGTLFRLDPAGTLTTLVNFTGANGQFPYAGLIGDAAGNLYGTTDDGGVNGFGTVYKYGANGTLTTLVSFDQANGAYPYLAGLIADAAGNLYGTTYGGGERNAGTVFRLDRMNKLTTLYSFAGGADGTNPIAGVTVDAVGNLYGTTLVGGVSGGGTVFKLTGAGFATAVPEPMMWVLFTAGFGLVGIAVRRRAREPHFCRSGPVAQRAQYTSICTSRHDPEVDILSRLASPQLPPSVHVRRSIHPAGVKRRSIRPR